MKERRISIASDADTIVASLAAKELAKQAGLSEAKAGGLVTATSELATNIVKYGVAGWITIRALTGLRQGVEVIAEDRGPGFESIERAMEDHKSTGGTLGLGLPGAKRLVDEFEIENRPDRGARVRIVKWK